MTETASRPAAIAPVIVMNIGYGLAALVTGLFVYLNSFFAGLDSANSTAHAIFAIALPITWLTGLVLSLVLRNKRRRSLTIGFAILLVLAVLIVVDTILLVPLFT